VERIFSTSASATASAIVSINATLKWEGTTPQTESWTAQSATAETWTTENATSETWTRAA
jgi:hypothetical protein